MAASWISGQPTGQLGITTVAAQAHGIQSAWQSPRLGVSRGGIQTRLSASAPTGNQGSLKVASAGNATSSSSPKQALRRMATTAATLRAPSPTAHAVPSIVANASQPILARCAAPPSPLLASVSLQGTQGSVRRSGSPPGVLKNPGFWRWQAEPEPDAEGSPDNTPDAPKSRPSVEKNMHFTKDGRSAQCQSPVLRFATSGLTVPLPSSACSPPPVSSSGMGMLAANGQESWASSRRQLWQQVLGGSQLANDGSLQSERSPRSSVQYKALVSRDISSAAYSGPSCSPGMVTRSDRDLGASSYSAPSSGSGSHLLPSRIHPSSGSTDTPKAGFVPPASIVPVPAQPVRPWRGKGGNATVPSPAVQSRPSNVVTPKSPSSSTRVLQSPARQAMVRAGSNPPGNVSRSPQSPQQAPVASASSQCAWWQRSCQAAKVGVSELRVDAPLEDHASSLQQSLEEEEDEAKFTNKILELENEVQRLHGLLQEERDASRVLKTALEANGMQAPICLGATDVLAGSRGSEMGGLLSTSTISVLPPFPMMTGIGAASRSRDSDSGGDELLGSDRRREEPGRDECRDAVESAASAAVLRLRSMNDSSGAAIAERILVAMRKTGEVGGADLAAVSEMSSAS